MFRLPLDMDGLRILHVKAAAALDPQGTRVRTGQGGVVDQKDGFTAGTEDHGGDDISLCKERISFRRVLCCPFAHPDGLGRHRDQGYETVSPVDVQHFRERAERVGRV